MVERRRYEVGGPGGRRLVVEDAGPRDGAVLLMHGGTPGTGSVYEPNLLAGAARGIRHVSYARPGYGGSDRDPGRSIADCAADAEAVVDQLGIDRFYTSGWSGGGPHALATVALLGERVRAAVIVASFAPRDAEGLDWLTGMAPENHVEFGAAEAGPEELETFLEGAASRLGGFDVEQPQEAFGGLLGSVDAPLFTNEIARHGSRVIGEALRDGLWGWFDDNLAFIAEWGCDLDSIRSPVSIWHGGDDRMVPLSHGRWLADHVPGARARLLPEEGHLSLELRRYGDILDELLELGDETVTAPRRR